jgi:polygalacturonase
VFENVDLSGTVQVRANGVTIRNVRITSNDYWPLRSVSGTGLVIEDVTVVAGPKSQAGIAVDDATIRRVDVSGGPDGLKLGSNVVLEASYIHDLAVFSGSHNDGVELSGTTNIRIIGNTILNQADQTSALFIGGNSSPTSDITVASNLFAGGGYTVYGPEGDPGVGPSSDVVVTNNRFSTRFYAKGGYFGPLAHWESGNGNQWSGNAWVDGPSAGTVIQE